MDARPPRAITAAYIDYFPAISMRGALSLNNAGARASALPICALFLGLLCPREATLSNALLLCHEQLLALDISIFSFYLRIVEF